MRHLCVAALLTLTVSASADDEKKADAPWPVVWSVTEGLQAPESAFYDAESGHLFLSQIGDGGGAKKDGDGWISKLTLDGKVVEDKWATGLNAPKGLRSHDGLLWVSDIARVVGFRIADGKQIIDVPIPDAKFLNDLATGPDGSVYVSDMVASRIYRFTDSKLDVFAEGEEIEHPNGLLVDGDQLVVGGWGTGFDPSNFTTKTLGRLLKIDLKTGERTAVTAEPTGHLDGIEADGRGGYIVTDWVHGKVFRITKKGKARELATFPKGAADHA